MSNLIHLNLRVHIETPPKYGRKLSYPSCTPDRLIRRHLKQFNCEIHRKQFSARSNKLITYYSAFNRHGGERGKSLRNVPIRTSYTRTYNECEYLYAKITRTRVHCISTKSFESLNTFFPSSL